MGKKVGKIISDLSLDQDKLASLCVSEEPDVRGLGASNENTCEEDKVLAVLLGVPTK